MEENVGIPVKVVWSDGTTEYRLCSVADIEWMLRNPHEELGTPTFRALRNFEGEDLVRKVKTPSTERV